MTKKEKIAAIMMLVTLIALSSSCIFTLIQNKPDGYKFRIEKLFYKIK